MHHLSTSMHHLSTSMHHLLTSLLALHKERMGYMKHSLHTQASQLAPLH